VGNKTFMVLVYIGIFFLVNEMCRSFTCYFKELKFNKYIVIENKILARILISEYAEGNKKVKPCDRNKMSIVGLIAYITLFPFNLSNMIFGIIKQVNLELFNNMSQNLLVKNVTEILIVLGILNKLILIINSKDCGYNPKRKKNDKQ
jgi:hypothetical protein